MPIEIVSTAGDSLYENPFIGAPGPVVNVTLDISTMTTAEVDAKGYLKPGVPVQASGALVSGTGQTVYGVTVEAQKMPGRTGNANLAGDTSDPMIAVATSGTINRDLSEDNLGRAYGANELTALPLGGFKLTTT